MGKLNCCDIPVGISDIPRPRGRPRKPVEIKIARPIGRPKDSSSWLSYDFKLAEEEYLIASEWDSMADCMKTDRLISTIRTMVRPELAVVLGIERGQG